MRKTKRKVLVKARFADDSVAINDDETSIQDFKYISKNLKKNTHQILVF